MEFAKKLLSKYGWKEGDGLGKNNEGIAKPLKAHLKFDKAGLGANQAADDFNNHWWERVFDEAANNVSVETKNDGVRVYTEKVNESVEITTKTYSIHTLKKAKSESGHEKYKHFLQSSQLTEAGYELEKQDRIATEDIEMKFTQLTDEELFRACEGRTAHKGARHGLKMSGKIARLEQQEQELLEKLYSNRKGSDMGTESETPKINNERIERKKQKRKKSRMDKDSEQVIVEETHEEKHSKESVNSKVGSKKQKRKIMNHTADSDVHEKDNQEVIRTTNMPCESIQESSGVKNPEARKKKRATIVQHMNVAVDEIQTDNPVSKSKKVKKSKAEKTQVQATQEVIGQGVEVEDNELITAEMESRTNNSKQHNKTNEGSHHGFAKARKKNVAIALENSNNHSATLKKRNKKQR